jgi:perosamine synthetase
VIPYGKQCIDSKDIAAVAAVFESEWLTTGPQVEAFEESFANRVGAKHAIAVNNGTSALHLAMLTAKIEKGDRVLTSPNTFLASANCAAFVGATPDFVDIDPKSYNLSPQQLESQWQHDTKAVIAVDYAGQTADTPAISKIAQQHGAIVIEDACHAVGGKFIQDGREWNVGGHPWADITTFSFHPVKTITTGEGGMLVTDNDSFASRARSLRTHGISRDPTTFIGLGDKAFDERGSWYYEMQEIGHNFRITDFQCALGLSQLSRLDSFVQRRRDIVKAYNSSFSDHELITIPSLRNESDRDLTSWHLYTLQIDFKSAKIKRSNLMNRLKLRGVDTQVLYIPVHLQPYYRSTFGYGLGKCPVAENFYLKALSLPLFPAMKDSDVDQVIQSVLKELN